MMDFNCHKCGGGFATSEARATHQLSCEGATTPSFIESSTELLDKMGLTLIRFLAPARGPIALCAMIAQGVSQKEVVVILTMRMYGEWSPRGGQQISLIKSDLDALAVILEGAS